MIFRKRGVLSRNLRFTYDNEQLEIVKRFVYLGIVFTPGGSFSDTQQTLAGQALKAVFMLNKHLYFYPNISVKHHLSLFDKLIAPILNYGCEVWGFSKDDSIEKVHTQFCKRLLNVKITTQTDLVYSELGRYSLQCHRYFRIVKFWFKIIYSDESKFIKHTYKQLLADCEHNRNVKNWAAHVRTLLSNLGFHEVWLNQGVGNIKLFLNILQERLKDTFVQNLEARITESPKARFYRLFYRFGFKEYLSHVTVKKFRMAITKLRLSSHRLEIEVGRFSRPKKEIHDRKCHLCNVVEDEFHFLFECPMYSQFRAKYISKCYWKHPNIPNLINLLSTTSPLILRRLGQYIYKSFKTRKNNVV